MAAFEYKGVDAKGAATAGIVDADSARTARQKLRKQGVFTTEIWEQKAGANKASRGQGLSRNVDVGKYFERISLQDVAEMTTQLSTLIGAGIPMVDGLSALVDQIENPKLKLVLVQVREKVNQGASLADAMRAHPKVFGDLYVNMVAAGEASGSLDIVLARLAEYNEASVRLRGQIISKLTYPLLMALIGAGIVTGLFVGVIPRIRRIFESFDKELPWLTQFMLGISDFLLGYWWLVLLMLGGVVYGVRRWVQTPAGRYKWHGWKIRVPIFGRINRLVAVSRFCRTFATLLSSGVPILTAVSIVKTVVENDVLSEAIETAGRNIAEGQSIAEPLKASGEFPPLVLHMIAVGEKTGELEPMLGKVADAYDGQVERSLSTLTAALEPLIIVSMGGVVMLVALSVLLPMLDMSNLAR